MSTKKHAGHPHLSGEHRFGDTGQLIFFVIFLGIWITDSFVFHYSTFLQQSVPAFVRVVVASPILIVAWVLARRGMKAVFGTPREKPEVINTGVFRLLRHPIYTGALMLYLGCILMTLSLASAALWLPIIAFYIYLCRYEEGILAEEFGDDYLQYKKKTGMLFPKLLKR